MNNEQLTQEEQSELDEYEVTIENNMKTFYNVGMSLLKIKTGKLYRQDYKSFSEYCKNRWDMNRSRAYQLVDAYNVATNLSTIVDSSTLRNESHLRPLKKFTPEQQREIWKEAIHKAPDGIVTAEHVETVANEMKVQFDISQEFNPSSKPVFNTTNENIDWAKWSWNPVTGCKHLCNYCYARDIANRFTHIFPNGFTPDFHQNRLSAPANTTIQESRKHEPGIHNVFICSMGDLFGHWVPQEWIDKVLETVRNENQWNFIFLSKNPERMVGIDWPENAWVGTTVDVQTMVDPAEEAFSQINASVKFVSCEPLLEPITFHHLSVFNWLIIGAQSKTSRVQEFQPEWDWVEQLLKQARAAECNVYFKPNLKVRPKEYPQR